jgi:hypothetical protein
LKAVALDVDTSLDPAGQRTSYATLARPGDAVDHPDILYYVVGFLGSRTVSP